MLFDKKPSRWTNSASKECQIYSQPLFTPTIWSLPFSVSMLSLLNQHFCSKHFLPPCCTLLTVAPALPSCQLVKATIQLVNRKQSVQSTFSCSISVLSPPTAFSTLLYPRLSVDRMEYKEPMVNIKITHTPIFKVFFLTERFSVTLVFEPFP